MNNTFLKRNIAAAISLFLMVSASTAQVLWNLKGGLMSHTVMPGESYYDGVFYKEFSTKSLDWMAGLELEIPINDRLNIETGLRYANRYVTIIDKDEGYHYGYGSAFDEKCSLLELPVRLAYKKDLGKNFSLHAGIGPYVSYALNLYGVDNNFQVGLEPSVSLYWHHINIGLTYNHPCFYKGYKNENNNAVMVTLGIRFKSKAWNYIGAGLLAVGTVAAAYSEIQGGGSGISNSYSTDDNSTSMTESSSSTSGSSLKTQYQNWERRAKANYESLTRTGTQIKKKKNNEDVKGTNGQSLNGGNYTIQKQQLREAQKEMRSIREKARKQGITIPQSNYETVTVSY